jgi:hypothetical protein
LLFAFEKRVSDQAFEFGQTVLQFGFLDRPQLQMHERCQTGSDPRVQLALVDVGDQPGYRVADGDRAVEVGQGILPDPGYAILLATNAAEFDGFGGVGVKKAEAALRGGRAARCPSWSELDRAS